MYSTTLPDIDQSNSSLNPESLLLQSKNKKAFSYYQALRDLKDVNSKLSMVKNRINLLTYKEEKAKHPVEQINAIKQERLRTQVREDNARSRRQLEFVRQKSQEEINNKRKEAELQKRSTQRKIQRAKRFLTEEKYRSHDQIREKSQQNLKIIEQFKHKVLTQKQIRHQQVVEDERRQYNFFRQWQESRIIDIKQEVELQTLKIAEKVKERQQELKELEAKCEFINNKQVQAMIKHRSKRVRKVHLPNSHSTQQVYKDTPLTSHSGAMSFVIIP